MFSKEQGLELPLGRNILNCPPPSPEGYNFAEGIKGLRCSPMQLKPFLLGDMIVPGEKKV
jgi:hypothetical protein